MDIRIQPLLHQLHQILQAYPCGIKEYELIQVLEEKNIPYFTEENLNDSLLMFRMHFLLFHLLYLLQDQLQCEGNETLEIHCLRIILIPRQNSEKIAPVAKDGLREYYLDWSNLENTTQEDVEQMLENFWVAYHHSQQREEALAILDLPASASSLAIKQKYYQLAKIHHPDHGGNPDTFRRIANAADVLLAS